MQKTATILFLILFIVSCASYDEYVQLSKEILEEPRQKIIELIKDTGKVTSMYIRSEKDDLRREYSLLQKFVDRDFQPDSVEL